MLGLSTVKPGSDDQWTVAHISCHSGTVFSIIISTSIYHKTSGVVPRLWLRNEMTPDSCAADLIFIFLLSVRSSH